MKTVLLLASLFILCIFVFFLSVSIQSKIRKNKTFFRLGSTLASLCFAVFLSLSIAGYIL